MSWEPDDVRGMALERAFEAWEFHNEQAFKHFLAVEQKRAERSGRFVLLLLVQFDEGAGAMPPSLIASLVSALAGCVREMDLIGWYRTGSIAGAVLTQSAEVPAVYSADRIGARVSLALRQRLPLALGTRLQVRVVDGRPVSE